jgi:hypothetical protein
MCRVACRASEGAALHECKVRNKYLIHVYFCGAAAGRQRRLLMAMLEAAVRQQLKVEGTLSELPSRGTPR